MTVPTNRVRAKKPKTKTGCRTCRIRRIKCDEKTPACDGCVSSGWVCDGYPLKGIASEKSAVPANGVSTKDLDKWIQSMSFLRRPWYLPLSGLNYHEGLAFTFFRQHTVSQLQDGMESQLWNRWALQISHQEPAILHAIIAVGAMHNARSNLVDGKPTKLQQIALGSYAKAVVELRDSMSKLDNHPGVDIVLMACILFVSFEMLMHEIPRAMDHLQLGLKIMNDKCTRRTSEINTKNGFGIIKGSSSDLLDELVPIFVRLDYGAPMFGRRHSMLALAHAEYNTQHILNIPTSFDSITQAKYCLDLLSSGVFRLRGELWDIAEEEALNAGLPSGSNESQAYIQARSRSVDLGFQWNDILGRKYALETGLAAFRKALDGCLPSVNIGTDRAALSIQIQYVLVFFTVISCREAYEVSCDGFQDLFENAIELAETYIKSGPGFAESLGRRNLSLEHRVIPAIFLVASKCRDPEIRARAIDLLEVACRQEAIWDGKPFATFMQHVSDLEANLVQSGPGIDISRFCNGFLSKNTHPEYARFCDVVIADEFDELGRGTIFCARYRHESDGLIDVYEHKIMFGEEK